MVAAEGSEMRRRSSAAAAAKEGDGEAASTMMSMSVERVFEGSACPVAGATHAPRLRRQLRARGDVQRHCIIPSLNVSAGLLGFFFVKTWTAALDRVGLLKKPFTRQENTVIQTSVVAAYGIAFSADLSPTSLHGLQGYKVFISIALILGDGLYNFVKYTVTSLIAAVRKGRTSMLPVSDDEALITADRPLSFDDERRTKLFLKDQIPQPVAYGGYVLIAVLSIVTLPHIFPQLKWYYILVAYIVAPVLAFCNAYGCGLTDWSLVSAYGKLAIFTIGVWAGASHGGVLVGLSACGVMMSIVSTASDLMQDFKTGYMTLASPRSIGSEYPAPYAIVFRNMAILGVDGFGSLPKHCLTLCFVFFAAAIVINLIRDLVPQKVARFIPLPMAMAIPFYIGSYFAIDMCVGSLILFVWEMVDKVKAEAFGPAVASGLICGDGLWTLPQSVLALAKVQPPICMKFLSRQMNDKVDAYITTIS
uniref:Metal-nicotianamine transporter YSL12 n=1 Tax=Ananas comosus var. bracteatus TaxID=296719 RepID=A0A6V7QKG4_ANACO|nr:unnamed protein product [Ananas comosus var. bracteatus]